MTSATAFDPRTEDFDLFAPGLMDDPYPAYQALRDWDPVHVNRQTGLYHLSRYQDVATLGKDRGMLIRGSALSGIFEAYRSTALHRVLTGYNIFAMDDPDHGRIKKLIVGAFTRSRVEGLAPRIEQLAAGLLDQAGLDQDRGAFDLVPVLAYPLPFLVICELLGVPGDDQDAFLGWTRAMLPVADPFPTPEEVRAAIEGAEAMEAYLTALLSERRRLRPAAAPPPPGLISDLLEISEQQDERLSGEELITLFVTLLVAGFENVTNLIGVTMRALIENPGQDRALRADPSLYRNLPDEALRYYSTTQYNIRQAAVPIERHGKTIPAGSMVILLRGAANRDERQFPDPDRFDLRRDNSATHVGFGNGATACTGAGLTRMETTIAFRLLHQRFARFHLAGWEQNPTRLFWGARSVRLEYERT